MDFSFKINLALNCFYCVIYNMCLINAYHLPTIGFKAPLRLQTQKAMIDWVNVP